MNLPEKWIWLPRDKYPKNQATVYSGFNARRDVNYTVAEFKKNYSFDKNIKSVLLRFSGDTEYQLYCNGEFVATGPAVVEGDFIGNDLPRGNFYSTQTELKNCGKTLNFFTRVKMTPVRICEYSMGHGGFMLSAVVTLEDDTKRIISTDSSWLSRLNGAYSDAIKYDGRILPDEYINAEEIENVWHTKLAPIPPRSEEMIYPEGNKIILAPYEEKEVYMEADKIYGGFLYVRSKSEGVLNVNALCGENKDEGRTAEIILNGNDEYRSFDFYSMGEIRVNVKNESDKPSELSVGFIFTHFPVSSEAKTVTNDNELNEVLDVCRHTLKICRQTHHLDSTTHCEPLACTGDYYIEALMTAFSFGDMRLAEFDILRTAELLRSNNGVMFHTSYSLIWVLMLYDTYLFTGNKKLLYACEDALIILLSRFEEYLGENGLIENPPNFMFVDWIYIDGLSLHHPPKALGQTCLNMFYYGALDTASKILNELSKYKMAQECDLKKQTLRLSINSLLFDEEKGLYFEGLNTETDRKLIGKYMPENVEKRYYLKHSNILAAYFGVCDKPVELIEKIMSDECKGEYQPYFAHYLLEAVYKNDLRDRYTLEILNMWKKPTLEFKKGLVEGFIKPEPSYSFDHSHAWGGTPLYSLPKALLGVEINKAGMSEITINPSLLGLTYAKAELPTPFGSVVCEMSVENNIKLTYPDEITVHLKNNEK